VESRQTEVSWHILLVLVEISYRVADMQVDVVSAAVDGGKLMGYFNLAWFAWGSAEMNLGDTVEYNTLVRVTSPYDRLATAIIKLFVHYNVGETSHAFSTVHCVYFVLLTFTAMFETITIHPDC